MSKMSWKDSLLLVVSFPFIVIAYFAVLVWRGLIWLVQAVLWCAGFAIAGFAGYWLTVHVHLALGIVAGAVIVIAYYTVAVRMTSD